MQNKEYGPEKSTIRSDLARGDEPLPSHCPTMVDTLAGMKNRILEAGMEQGRSGEILAQFGEAVLVRVCGRIVLRGGSMADRMEALEWMAMFMPDEVATLKG